MLSYGKVSCMMSDSLRLLSLAVNLVATSGNQTNDSWTQPVQLLGRDISSDIHATHVHVPCPQGRYLAWSAMVCSCCHLLSIVLPIAGFEPNDSLTQPIQLLGGDNFFKYP